MPGTEKKPFKVAIVDITDSIRDRAVDIAEARMTGEKAEMKGLGGLMKRFWKHGVWREYYENRYQAEASESIKGEKNLYLGEADQAASKKAIRAIMDRFLTEYDEVIHEESGEGRRQLGDHEEEDHQKTELEIKKKLTLLIRGYASGAVDKEAFLTEKNRLIAQAAGFNKDFIEKGNVFADNMLKIANEVKLMVDHGKSLGELDIELDITIGRAKLGARSETQYTALESVIEKLNQSTLGRFIGNEAYLGGAVASAYVFSSFVTKRALLSRTGAVLSFGGTALAMGVIAGARERSKLERERKLHARQRATGMKFEEDDGVRRQEMESFRFGTKSALGMARSIGSRMDKDEETGQFSLDQPSKTKFHLLVQATAEAEARISLSDRKKADFLSYSDVAKVEQERLLLDISRAAFKAELRRAFNANRIKYGYNQQTSFDDFWQDTLKAEDRKVKAVSGFSEKDKAFRNLKFRRGITAGSKATFYGVAFGAVIQETAAAVSAEQFGLIDAIRESWGGDVPKATGDNFTVMEFLRHGGELPQLEGGGSSFNVDGGILQMQDGITASATSDGLFDLLGSDGQTIVSGLETEADGSLTAASIEKIKEAGGSVDESTILQSTTLKKDVSVTQNEWLAEEGVARKDDVFFDNDTNFRDPITGEYTSADYNELGLNWGGQGGTGIRADGDYEFDVSSMLPEGSFHKGATADTTDLLKAGELKILISLSIENADQVFELNVTPDGKCIIDKDSLVGQHLFKEVDGNAVFTGHFAQVAQVREVVGSVHHYGILSTHQGTGLEGDIIIPGEVPSDVPVSVSKINFQAENTVGVPPLAPPIISRIPLERRSSSPSEQPAPTGSQPTPPTTPGASSTPGEEPQTKIPGQGLLDRELGELEYGKNLVSSGGGRERGKKTNWVNRVGTLRHSEKREPSEDEFKAILAKYQSKATGEKVRYSFLRSELGKNLEAWSMGEDGTIDPDKFDPAFKYLMPVDFMKMADTYTKEHLTPEKLAELEKQKAKANVLDNVGEAKKPKVEAKQIDLTKIDAEVPFDTAVAGRDRFKKASRTVKSRDYPQADLGIAAPAPKRRKKVAKVDDNLTPDDASSVDAASPDTTAVPTVDAAKASQTDVDTTKTVDSAVDDDSDLGIPNDKTDDANPSIVVNDEPTPKPEPTPKTVDKDDEDDLGVPSEKADDEADLGTTSDTAQDDKDSPADSATKETPAPISATAPEVVADKQDDESDLGVPTEEVDDSLTATDDQQDLGTEDEITEEVEVTPEGESTEDQQINKLLDSLTKEKKKRIESLIKDMKKWIGPNKSGSGVPPRGDWVKGLLTGDTYSNLETPTRKNEIKRVMRSFFSRNSKHLLGKENTITSTKNLTQNKDTVDLAIQAYLILSK